MRNGARPAPGSVGLPAEASEHPGPAAPTRPRTSRRRGPGWVPNQHGAWAMLATPLLVGILASGFRWIDLPLTVMWFLGYFAFFATGLWLKSGRKPRYWPPVRAYTLLAAIAGLVVLALDPRLLQWAPLFVLPMAVGLYASAQRRDRALLAGMATSIGSSLMVLVAYDAGGGSDVHRAWLLTLVLAGYFAGTVVYVKTMIRERGSHPHYWLSVGWHAVITLALIPVSSALVFVFALLTIRAAMVPSFRVSPKALGIGEAVATVVVALTALVTI
ncbi:MAG: YwiC-like family protein [Nostocoides sp.]